jgi:phage tail sheath protein FI
MPEYLSPGVYVEEIDTGNKPIEGVSTSTAGMLGVTERGPVNVPILITSYGEYRRWFGERLPLSDFSNAAGPHCFLPHAVEGFFQNEGQRVYVTRALDTSAGAAANSTDLLFDRGDPGVTGTVLLRAAGEETGTAGDPPLLFVLDDTGLTAGTSWIRIGDGSTAEYRIVDTINTTPAHMLVALAFPLELPHAASDAVDEVTVTSNAAYTGAITLAQNIIPGELEFDLAFTVAADVALMHAGELLEIGGGTGEFHVIKQVTPGPLSATVVLETPIAMAHAAAAAVTPLTISAPVNSSTLALAASAADSLIFLNTSTGFTNATHLVRVHSSVTNQDEFSRIGALAELVVEPGAYQAYPAASLIEKVDVADDDRHLTLGVASPPPPNTNTVTLDNTLWLNAGDQLIIEPGANQEVMTVKSTAGPVVTLTGNLSKGHVLHSVVTPAFSLKSLTAPASAGSRVLAVDNRIGLSTNDVIRIGDSPDEEYATIQALPDRAVASPDAGTVVLDHPLLAGHLLGAAVRRQNSPALDTVSSAPPVALALPVAAGTVDWVITDSTNYAPVATQIIGDGAGATTTKYFFDGGVSAAEPYKVSVVVKNQGAQPVVIGSNLGGSAPIPPGTTQNIALNANGDGVTHIQLIFKTNAPADVLDVVATAPIIAKVSDGVNLIPAGNRNFTGWTASGGEGIALTQLKPFALTTPFARVTTPTGAVFYHRLVDTPTIHPAEIAVKMPPPAVSALERAHAAGGVVVARNPLIEVEAIDPGAWGDRLRIAIEDEAPGLVSRTLLTTIVNATHVRLASVAGVESGTILELLDPLNNDAVVGDPIKVVSIDRTTNYTLTLAGTGLSAAQQAAQAAAVVAHKQLGVRSREFRLTVLLMHQPDPSLPSRSEQVVDSEVFRNLSMDSRHSRYFETIIGDIDGALRLDDRRPEGESWYVRVHDLAQDLTEPTRTNTLESVRLGPEALVDVLPNGRTRAARQALEGGNDSIATLTDDIYTGQDDVDPEKRTGLFTFVNVDEISIVSVPGRTSPVIQGALIDFCENNRYCFAVLDGPVPPIVWLTSNDSLADVQAQRQQFDTKYAALYHPWLLIEDPFPINLAKISNYPVPPSGHVIGVYARTDVERGVHKAPANEVVSGIIGLQRIINKPEQDILNPYPVNINVIRDFRPNERGIRIWGGRVITSDTDWKYVNVRRLLIFIEKSIDRGLQWVVFEPNAEPLWARVRRTISNFLTTVWRNGGLEGTKPEEAFFVKCDRTTMTQTDIDNGKLIAVIGVAPVKPAEFVIIRIGLFTANASS